MASGLWRIGLPASDAAAGIFEAALEPFCDAVSRTETGAGQWYVEGVCGTEPDPVLLGVALDLAAAAAGVAVPGVRVEAVPLRDWVADNQSEFPPIGIGRFFIHGSHVRGPFPASRIALRVDPAVAFGSGRHASTSGCLEALDHLSRRRFERPLDVGCGSGILALAMTKLWRVPVLAADIDPAAVTVTRTNARLNGVASRVRAVSADGYAAPAIRRGRPFDLIVCNILARPLKRMARDLAAHLAPGGVAVLSGFLARDADGVLAAHRATGLRLRRRVTVEDWQTLIVELPARRREPPPGPSLTPRRAVEDIDAVV
jgi:ribosomal protein L11 methyltransferase